MSSDGIAAEKEGTCGEVEMTPTQHNEVVEDKLVNLGLVMQCTLTAFRRVEGILQNGKIDWRKALARAIKRTE